jgi:hypothetical protein
MKVSKPKPIPWIALMTVIVFAAAMVIWTTSAPSGEVAVDSLTIEPSPSSSEKAEGPVPAGVVAVGDWQTTEQLFPDRFTTLDALVGATSVYLRAGIKFPRPGSGVTIEVTDVGPAESHLLAKIVGGSTEAMVGSEFMFVARNDGHGWRLDPTGTSRVFCSRRLSGRAGTACL